MFWNYFVLFVFVLNQRVCIKGLAQIKTLIGSVEVYGSVLGPDHDPVEIFCPSTSSLAVLSEHSEENSSRGINLKRTFQDVLQNQPPEVMKKALVRSRKSATVLLMKSLQTVETNFVCSFQRFHDIFSLNLGKVFVGSLPDQSVRHQWNYEEKMEWHCSIEIKVIHFCSDQNFDYCLAK